ncbi:arabinose ABC transporter permease, partial [Desulfocarbo indianensis]
LPPYASIGHSAIYLLALFRFMQGIAFGGSWDGLPSLLALNAPENKRGWYAMLGQLGAPTGFIIAGALFLFLYSSLTFQEFIDWGWRYPFYVAFAINVVALFARLRLVVTHEYTQLLEEGELEPISTLQMVNAQGFNIFLGAFAALASYALFHLVTVFPLSWVVLRKTQSVSAVLAVQIVGAVIALIGTLISGLIADRIGRRTTLAAMAVLIGIFSLATPWLLDGGVAGQDTFILV